MKRLLSLMLVVATTLSVAACSDSTGPAGPLSGTYSLSLLGGSPPPAPLFYNSAWAASRNPGSAAHAVQRRHLHGQLPGAGYDYDLSPNVSQPPTAPRRLHAPRSRSRIAANKLSNVSYGVVTNNRISIDNFSNSGLRAEYTR